MTKDDIDKLWHQAMDEAVKNGEAFTRHRFANLVAAAEREECARLCLETEPFYGVMFYNAIRARGNT